MRPNVPNKDTEADPRQCRKRVARTIGCYGRRANDSTYSISYAGTNRCYLKWHPYQNLFVCCFLMDHGPSIVLFTHLA